MATPSHLNWATDYDVVDPSFVADPYPVYEELRGTCPVAHSDRWGGSWMPTKYDDIVAIAHDIDHFSSAEVGVIRAPEGSPDPFPLGLPPAAINSAFSGLRWPQETHTRVLNAYQRDMNRL